MHRALGPGLLESVYESVWMIELAEMKIAARRQVEGPVIYKGQDLGMGFRADVLVQDRLLLELKSVDEINSVHIAHVITYLKFLRFKRGFLLNFGRPLLKEGIKRISI